MPSQKNYIFGYGSLVSRESVMETLKRDPGTLYPATLNGWLRDWGVVLDNSTTIRRFELRDDRSVPKYVLALNVRKPSAAEHPTNPNGVLFEVSDQDIKVMDAREQHYTRVDVTEYVSSGAKGKIYTYVGLKKHETLESHIDDAILPLSYLNLVLRGFDSIGDTSGSIFRSTTVFPEIIAKDTIHTSGL